MSWPRKTLALAMALMATMMLMSNTQAASLPKCRTGTHFRGCWRECEEKSCERTDPVSAAACLKQPMLCAKPAMQNSWSKKEIEDFQRTFCRCDDVNAIFDEVTRKCVSSPSECTNNGGKDEVVPTECPSGMVFKTCGTACPKTCGHAKPDFCTAQCVAGCFCQNPNRWFDPLQNRCVRKRNCSSDN